jgi:hypothetical protein
MRLWINGIAVSLVVMLLGGCAIGVKKWPEAVKEEDRFELKLLEGSRNGQCMTLRLAVEGAANRLESVLVQYEIVGEKSDEGCIGCPFIPREAELLQPGDEGFELSGNDLTLSFCTFEPDREYRFRVAGVNALSSLPSASTAVYVADPSPSQ